MFTASGWPAAHPQLPPAALVAQHAVLSAGPQHVACVSGVQQEDVGSVSR